MIIFWNKNLKYHYNWETERKGWKFEIKLNNFVQFKKKAEKSKDFTEFSIFFAFPLISSYKKLFLPGEWKLFQKKRKKWNRIFAFDEHNSDLHSYEG